MSIDSRLAVSRLRPASTAPYSEARAAVASLPPLPSHIRYLDEYDDTFRTVPAISSSDTWRTVADTRPFVFDFTRYRDADSKLLLKHLMFWSIAEFGVSTAHKIFVGLRRLQARADFDVLLAGLERPFNEWNDYWETTVRVRGDALSAHALKILLGFLSEMYLGLWQPGHREFIRSLRWPRPPVPVLNGVTSGDDILSTHEEALIIEFLDHTSERVNKGGCVTGKELLAFCLLCLSYEHGLRPVQMGRIDLANLRTYRGDDGRPIVHFTAFRAKKRIVSDKVPFVRKIKREWAPPFAEWLRRREEEQASIGRQATSSDKAFPIPISTIINGIGDTVEGITGVRRTATDLRHTAAQRLVDAGASVEEVAHFLGHSYWDTSLIYFEASAAQGPLINKALAASPIYSRIVEIGTSGFIDRAALEAEPGENQIGAVPHGIPVSGIGACALGQSLCSLNPALSCYTCRKFIPIDEPEIHRQVLENFRQVVRRFYDDSRGERQSPAFVQLRTMLDAVQRVISALENPDTGNASDE